MSCSPARSRPRAAASRARASSAGCAPAAGRIHRLREWARRRRMRARSECARRRRSSSESPPAPPAHGKRGKSTTTTTRGLPSCRTPDTHAIAHALAEGSLPLAGRRAGRLHHPARQYPSVSTQSTQREYSKVPSVSTCASLSRSFSSASRCISCATAASSSARALEPRRTCASGACAGGGSEARGYSEYLHWVI